MRTFHAAILLAFSFQVLAASNPLAPTPAEAGTQPKASAAKENGKTNPDQRGTKALPLVTDIGPSSTLKVEAAEKSEKHEDYSSHEWWLVYLTAALAAITGALAVFTAFLWGATKRLVGGSEETARRQLRAYVFLDPEKEFTFVRKPSVTATVETEIHVKNLGLTPAYDVFCHSWMTVDVWPLPENFVFVGPSGDEPLTRSVVPPGGLVHFHTGTCRPFTPDELAAVESGARRLYIYGQITYTDTFGRQHWTNFCQGSTALGREGFRTALAKCDRHNDTDRN